MQDEPGLPRFAGWPFPCCCSFGRLVPPSWHAAAWEPAACELRCPCKPWKLGRAGPGNCPTGGAPATPDDFVDDERSRIMKFLCHQSARGPDMKPYRVLGMIQAQGWDILKPLPGE